MQALSTLDRDFFLSLYKRINSDIDYNTESCEEIPPILVQDFTHTVPILKAVKKQLDQNGFALVEFNPYRNFMDVLEWATHVIGEPMKDSSHSEKIYSKIVAERDGKYFSNTHYTQPLHTDDAHVANTPRIISLLCEKQSKAGGITTLVKFSDIYPQLIIDSQETRTCLYSEEAIKLEGVKGILNRPLFYHLENNRQGLVFPAFLFSIQLNEQIVDIFKQMVELLHNRKNQIRFKLKPGQLLIIDNFRVLHGRTQFALSEERLLYRFCFKDNMKTP